MKWKFIYTAIIVLSFSGAFNQVQAGSAFLSFCNLFPEMTIPFPIQYKNDLIPIKPAVDINKQDAMRYLHFSEEDLRMNNPLVNFDENIVIDRWQEALPTIVFKIKEVNYIALIYTLAKFPNVGLETYKMFLSTFTYEGQMIDSINVRSQYPPEMSKAGWRDVVFLKKNILRIFDYKPNMENYNIKYDIIDEKKPITVVEISDYQIDETGKIKLIKTHPKQYLKEFVSYYESYHKDSDDPMNEFDF
jgi:hypothetical protein